MRRSLCAPSSEPRPSCPSSHCSLTSVLQASLPKSNPAFLDGRVWQEAPGVADLCLLATSTDSCLQSLAPVPPSAWHIFPTCRAGVQVYVPLLALQSSCPPALYPAVLLASGQPAAIFLQGPAVMCSPSSLASLCMGFLPSHTHAETSSVTPPHLRRCPSLHGHMWWVLLAPGAEEVGQTQTHSEEQH